MYVIKHIFTANNCEKSCKCTKYALSLHRDFFIVLDLRLTKIGSKALLPFAFLRGYIIEFQLLPFFYFRYVQTTICKTSSEAISKLVFLIYEKAVFYYVDLKYLSHSFKP